MGSSARSERFVFPLFEITEVTEATEKRLVWPEVSGEVLAVRACVEITCSIATYRCPTGHPVRER